MRLYHHEGEQASKKQLKSLELFIHVMTSSIEQTSTSLGLKLSVVNKDKDQSLTDNLIDRCKSSGSKLWQVNSRHSHCREGHEVLLTPPKLTLKFI